MTRGDPESPLRWTCKSTSKLAKELQKVGHQVFSKTVYSLLRSMDYSLQSNRKTEEGKDHPDRDAQFQHIAKTVSEFQQNWRGRLLTSRQVVVNLIKPRKST
jgi:hypothetical protein